MAELCQQCAEAVYGVENLSDFYGLTTPEESRIGRYAVVLCEGCGPCQVDNAGRCVSSDCLASHGGRSVPSILEAGNGEQEHEHRCASCGNRFVCACLDPVEETNEPFVCQRCDAIDPCIPF